MIVVTLLALPAAAETLEVALGTQTGLLYSAVGSSVGLSLKGPAGESAAWENIESSALSIRCAEDAKPPENQVVTQLQVHVGDKKWALAGGSTVNFTCGDGKLVTVTDLHGRKIASFGRSLALTVEKIRTDAR